MIGDFVTHDEQIAAMRAAKTRADADLEHTVAMLREIRARDAQRVGAVRAELAEAMGLCDRFLTILDRLQDEPR